MQSDEVDGLLASTHTVMAVVNKFGGHREIKKFKSHRTPSSSDKQLKEIFDDGTIPRTIKENSYCFCTKCHPSSSACTSPNCKQTKCPARYGKSADQEGPSPREAVD
jgi:hypothetical protein